MEKKKASAAHIRATAKWEKTNYFKTLVRFRADDEDRIRAAAGDSLNGFIVSAVLDAVRKSEAGPEAVALQMEPGTREKLGEHGLNPEEIAAQAIKDKLEEIRAGII